MAWRKTRSRLAVKSCGKEHMAFRGRPPRDSEPATLRGFPGRPPPRLRGVILSSSSSQNVRSHVLSGTCARVAGSRGKQYTDGWGSIWRKVIRARSSIPNSSRPPGRASTSQQPRTRPSRRFPLKSITRQAASHRFRLLGSSFPPSVLYLGTQSRPPLLAIIDRPECISIDREVSNLNYESFGSLLIVWYL